MQFDPLRDHVQHASAGQVRSDTDRNGGAVVSAADMDGLAIRLADAVSRPAAGEPTSAEHLCEGDVLVSARGNVGKVAVVSQQAVGAAVSANVLVLRLKSSLLPQVLWAFLTSPLGRKGLEAATLISGAQKAISLESLLAVRVPVPPPDIQREIAAAVENGLRSYRSSREAAELRLTILRQSLSQVLTNTRNDGGKHGNA